MMMYVRTCIRTFSELSLATVLPQKNLTFFVRKKIGIQVCASVLYTVS